MRPPHSFRAFTMLELLSAVAIIALLVTAAIWGYITVTSWARTTTDRQVLTILNDALTRYKTQGGNVSSLTVGANIGALIGRMRTNTSWAGQAVSHQFLSQGVTFPARSIDATGAQASYQFYRFNTFSNTTPGFGVPTSKQNYGSGVGYIADSSGNISFQVSSTSGYIAVQPSGGAISIWPSGNPSYGSVSGTSATFWSCAGAADSTPSGVITSVDCNGNSWTGSVTSVDVSGLTSLGMLMVHENPTLTSLNISGLTSLIDVGIDNTALTSFTLANQPGLLTFSATGCGNLTSLTLSNCPTLTDVYLGSSGLTSLTISNMTALTLIGVSSCQMNASALNSLFSSLSTFPPIASATIDVSGNPGAGSANNSIATAKNWTVIN